jgi:hypothetical protein
MELLQVHGVENQGDPLLLHVEVGDHLLLYHGGDGDHPLDGPSCVEFLLYPKFEIMTQGETLEELEENMRDAYRLMALEDVPENHEVKELALKL